MTDQKKPVKENRAPGYPMYREYLVDRRRFLTLSLLGGAAAMVSGCKDEGISPVQTAGEPVLPKKPELQKKDTGLDTQDSGPQHFSPPDSRAQTEPNPDQPNQEEKTDSVPNSTDRVKGKRMPPARVKRIEKRPGTARAPTRPLPFDPNNPEF
jgi:hypothetical protein